ncbi:hypothetical protein ACJH6H_26510 [Mycobacterium sp. SMC-21]|uniref:hypothetical protein n=1 Tax=Mycobacterium sp. SMC-21 TaxID=3381632 RepID=UPI00387657C2
MTNPTDIQATRTFIDQYRMAPLDDVGATDWLAAMVVVVDPTGHRDGIEVPILVNRNVNSVHDMFCTLVEHEQVGSLPGKWQAAVRDAVWRCGRQRRDGGRCRAQVGQSGDACIHHRGQSDQLQFGADG